MNYENHKTEASVIADLCAKSKEIRSVETAQGERKVTLLAVPEGTKAQSIKPFLDEYLTAPERKKGRAIFGDLDSFIEHTNRFKDSDSAIFASPEPTQPTLTSVLNYHRIGSAGAPRYGDHRGVYNFPLSEEWKAWKEWDGKSMDQASFAEFVEDRLADVTDPAGAFDQAKAFAALIGVAFATPTKLLELSRGLTMRVESKCKEVRSTSTGEVSIQYETTHNDENGAPLKVPGAFLICIPIFRNDAPYQIAARLRYRRNGAQMLWFYELYRADAAFEHAFKVAANTAREKTELPLFTGCPE